MGNTDKARQQAYRRRMQEQGYRQFAFWLDENTQVALKLLKTVDTDLSTLVCEAIRHYHAYLLSRSATRGVASNSKAVTGNEEAKFVTSNVISNRYMTHELEDHILELRQAKMTLNEVAQRLFSEGYRNAKGEPYSSGTISKAEARAKARHASR